MALIKRALKVAIVVGVLAFGVSTLGPMAQSFQENYKFEVQDGVATILADGQTVKLDRSTIKDLELVNQGAAGYILKVKYVDGLGSIKIPTFMVTPIKSYVGKMDIPLSITE